MRPADVGCTLDLAIPGLGVALARGPLSRWAAASYAQDMRASMQSEPFLSPTTIVALRGLGIVVVGVYVFEFWLDYRLPSEHSLLLYFVAIPIIWATLGQLWTSYSYSDLHGPWMTWASHALTVCMLTSSVFLISAVLNTVRETLDPIGSALFHFVGWTVLLALVFHDVLDMHRSCRPKPTSPTSQAGPADAS